MSVSTQGSSFTRPRLGLIEVGLLLYRAIPLMLLVFIPLAAVGLWGAFQLEKNYVAFSRILVSPSEEYVFRPRVGDGVQNQLPEVDQLTLTEIELLLSPVVAERVLDQFGLERLYPEAAELLADASEEDRYEKSQAGLIALQENFEAYSSPKQSVVFMKFTHRDPQLSADVLNALIDSYLTYRAEIFEDQSPNSLGVQRAQFEDQLAIAEDDLRRFLADNEIADFATERTTAQTLFANIQQALFENTSRQSELDGQLLLLRQQLGQVSPSIDIFVEDSSSQSIIALELEREELLTRYKPGSKALQDINQRIARARQYIGSNQRPTGTVRRGPNPVYQNIETRLSQASAQAASIRLQKQELDRQALVIRSRQGQLAGLEPEWQELVRRRDLLESNVLTFATREVEARSLSEIAKEGSENIKVLERARRPAKGESLTFVAVIASLVIAAITALLVGLGFALTRKGFATPRSLERTTGLPVVSAIKSHR